MSMSMSVLTARSQMRGLSIATPSSWRRAASTASRPVPTTATPAPPPPRPWKPVPAAERLSRLKPASEQSTSKPKSFITRMFSLSSSDDAPVKAAPEPLDPERGMQASLRYVREGIKDPRYGPAARKVTMLICALPLAIYLTWELFQRRFNGKTQKVRPVRKVEPEVVTGTEGAT